VAEAAGVNRESLYKTLKGGSKTRYETIQKLMLALGVELTVQPIATNQATKAVAGKP
jgi:probable addiction module antidote protein